MSHYDSRTVVPALIAAGVSPMDFTASTNHGINREGHLVLRQDGDEWAIVVLDRSDVREDSRYASEGQAADAFYALLTGGS
jgi:hypothetical protein